MQERIARVQAQHRGSVHRAMEIVGSSAAHRPCREAAVTWGTSALGAAGDARADILARALIELAS